MVCGSAMGRCVQGVGKGQRRSQALPMKKLFMRPVHKHLVTGMRIDMMMVPRREVTDLGIGYHNGPSYQPSALLGHQWMKSLLSRCQNVVDVSVNGAQRIARKETHEVKLVDHQYSDDAFDAHEGAVDN